MFCNKFMNPFNIICFLIPLLCILHIRSNAQDILDADTLHEVRLYFYDSEYESLLESKASSFRPQIGNQYIKSSIKIDGQVIDTIGVRYKGRSSYFNESEKKSFKIDFNEFIKGQKFQGLKKLNLHNGYADPSLVRDPLVYHLFRKIGVHAPQTSFARVYINDDYSGIYQIVEQVDDSFAVGNLFKNLEWNALSLNSYQRSIESKGERNEDAEKFLKRLVSTIDKLEGEQFRDSLNRYLDIDQFLRILAIYVATGNYDSVIGTGRNWYLQLPLESEKFQWIPWDNNMSFDAIFPSIKEDCLMTPDFASLVFKGKKVQFYDLSEYYSKVERRWEFGDGQFSNDLNPTHFYRRRGKYEVCMTINMSGHCEKKVCKKINLKSKTGICPTLTDQLSPNLFAKTIEQSQNCCEEWTGTCDDYYQNIKVNDEVYEFGFYAEESKSVLVQKLMNVPEYKSRYKEIMCQVLDEIINGDNIEAFLERNYNIIGQAVKDDPHLRQEEHVFLEEVRKSESRYYLGNIIKQRRAELLADVDCY